MLVHLKLDSIKLWIELRMQTPLRSSLLLRTRADQNRKKEEGTQKGKNEAIFKACSYLGEK